MDQSMSRAHLSSRALPIAAGTFSSLHAAPSVSSEARCSVLSSTAAFEGADLAVDRDKGQIRGVTVIAEGEARGHGFFIDRRMLEQVSDAINSTPGRGLKSRFGHPNILQDGIGTFIGRLSNARVNDGKVSADLTLADSAKQAPSGDLNSYVLSLAEDDPSAAGMSISFEHEQPEEKEGQVFARLANLFAADLVDEPAASPSGMFNHPETAETFGTRQTENSLMQRLRRFLETKGLKAEATDEETEAFVRDQLDDSDRAEAERLRRETADGDDSEDAVAEARRSERERVEAIRQLASDHGMGDDFVSRHIGAASDIADVKEDILKRWKSRGADHRDRVAQTVTAGQDLNADTLAAGIRDGLLLRASSRLPEGYEPHERSREFRGLALFEVGRAYLNAVGVPGAAGMNRSQLASIILDPGRIRMAASGHSNLYHAIGDFPNILIDAINKAAMRELQEQQPTWNQWAIRGTAPDFKNIHRVRISEAPDLKPINGDGEISYATLTDSGETYALAEYGQIIPVTRKVIINDDLNFLNSIPRKQARASRRLEDDVAYGALTSNPTMSEDNNALFSSDHNNLFSGSGQGGPPSVETFDDMFQAMRDQKDLQGMATVGVAPAYVLLPSSLDAKTRAFLNAEFNPDSSDTQREPNVFRSSVTPIVANQLSNDSQNRWYLTANPNDIDTVEVSFLEGEPNPVFGQEVDFDTEGMKMKVRHTVAARALDYRGLARNNGS